MELSAMTVTYAMGLIPANQVFVQWENRNRTIILAMTGIIAPTTMFAKGKPAKDQSRIAIRVSSV
jgi:hypothetical protein